MDEQDQAARWSRRSASRWVLGASVLLSCPLGACEEGRAAPYGSSRAVSPAASWCSAMCSTYQRCEGAVSLNCLSECEARNRAFLARNSDASLQLQTECMRLARCTPDLNDLLDECYSETFLGLEPSAASLDLCAAMAAPFFECSWFGTPQSCGQFHAVFSAPALASEEECAGASCEELGACIETRLYAFGE